MIWRPEGLKNPFNPAAVEARDGEGKPLSHYDAFEMALEALLEALKNQPSTIVDRTIRPGSTTVLWKGFWVFIPE